MQHAVTSIFHDDKDNDLIIVDSKIGVNNSVVRCIEHRSEVEDTTVKRVTDDWHIHKAVSCQCALIDIGR